MALVKCTECGKEISDKAPACIHCGCPRSAKQPKQINMDMFQDLFSGAVKTTMTVNFIARVQGPASEKTQQCVYVKDLDQTFRFHVPNTIQPSQSIRLVGQGRIGPDGKRGDILFTVTSVESVVPQPATPSASEASVAQFKAKRKRALAVPVVCLFVCAISLLVTRITQQFYFIIPFFITFFPAILGLCKLLAILFGDKVNRSIEHLEQRGLLGPLLAEKDSGRLVPFGDKASLSDHFLFRNNGKGILLACDDILWVYTRRGNRYENLMLGTRHLGVVTLSGQDASLAGVLNKYQEKIVASVTELQRRNPNVLVGDSPENRVKYQALRDK